MRPGRRVTSSSSSSCSQTWTRDRAQSSRASYAFVDATAAGMFFFFMGGVPFSRLLPGLLRVSNSPKAYTAFSFYTPIGTTSYRKLDRPIVFLCRTENYPFWIVPMWNDRAVLLSSGGTEPIDELVFNPKEAVIPMGSLVGWVSRRFNGSSAIGGTVDTRPNDSHGPLGGTVGGPFPTSMGAWSFVMVFHQMNDFVALPFGPENGLPASDAINVVDMLSEQEAVGRNLDKKQLATTNFGSWARDLSVARRSMDGERSEKDESDS